MLAAPQSTVNANEPPAGEGLTTVLGLRVLATPQRDVNGCNRILLAAPQNDMGIN